MDAGVALVAVVLLGLAILLVARRLSQQRARILEREARELGFSFSRYTQPFLTSNVQGLTRLLHHGPSTRAENVVQGSAHGWPMCVFDLPTYSSLSETASTATFAAFRSPGRLPIFDIYTKNVVERARDAVGGKAKKPEANLEFARRYCVRCTDESTKREFFTSARLEHLNQRCHEFHILSSPEWLLMYRPGTVTHARKLREFVNTTTAIASGLLELNPPLTRSRAM